MADSSARISARVRPLLRLKSAATSDTPTGANDAAQKEPRSAFHRSIRQNAAKPANTSTKGQKLTVAKARGKQEAWTVKTGQSSTFRIRLTESGYAVVLTWKDEAAAKWLERYCCYLSKGEWAKARKGSLSAFASLIIGKIEERKGKEKADAAKLDDLIARIRSIE